MLSGGGLRQRSWQTRSFMSVADLSMTGCGAIIRKKAKKRARAGGNGENKGETAKKNCDLPDDVL